MEQSILFISDNLNFLISLYKYIQCEITEIKKIYIGTNEMECEEYIEKFQPNIVILNLTHHIEDKIKIFKKNVKTDIKIIIIFNKIESINKMNLQDFYNIVKIYVKPFEYSKLKKDLIDLIDKKSSNNLELLISEELSKFNFNRGSIGYKYLINCIAEILKFPEKLDNIEKILFPHVAIQLKIDNPKVIKWSIHKLIDSMIRYTDEKIILRYFPHNNKPTIKSFLSFMYSSLIHRYNEK